MVGYIFMSYSRKDEEIMQVIAKSLRSQGLKVWVDNEKLIPGTPVWEEEVERGIMNASAIVVILSPDAKSSEWVRREITLADQHNKRVFPVLTKGDENTSITLRLINRQYVDLRENLDKGLKSLADTLSFYISDLSLQERRLYEQARRTAPFNKADIVHEQEKKQKPILENTAVKQPERAASKATNSQPREAPAKGRAFGWLSSRKSEARRLIPLLEDPNKREQAVRDLIQLDKDALPMLLEALQTRDLDLLPIYQQVLARIPSAPPSLIKILREDHPVMRARAADILGLRKDKTTVPALLDALKGEYYTVRARAAIALGRIGDRQAVDPLLKALKDSEDDVRIGACLGLGFFKEPSTFDEITNVLLDDAKIEVRQAAAKALGNTRHPAAVPYLMEALRDSFWWYEREIQAGDLFTAIEHMGAPAVMFLIEALKDNEGTVRKYAAYLLGRIGDARAIEPLGMALYDLHHDVGKASAEALVNFGERSFEILVEALDHPEMWIRIHSVDVLPRIDEPRVALVLLEMLKDPEREVRKHVIEAMGELKDPRTLPALQEIMAQRGDREMHALAKAAIEKIK